jgi:hypothetical protein
MENLLDPELSFAAGYVANRDLVVIVGEQDKFAQSRPHSLLFFLQKGKWSKMLIDWPIVSVCQIKNRDEAVLLSLGVDGRVHLASRQGVTVEQIEGADVTGVLAQVRNIDEQAYVVGIARQAYKRQNRTWMRIDEGVRQSPNDETVRGFLAVDGLNSTDIYSVGYAGEIWHFDGVRWASLPSPTNLALNAIRCVTQREVYVAGQCGTVIRGYGGTWEVLGAGQITDDIWGCEFFNGHLYVSTSKDVYLFDQGTFKKEDIGLSTTGAASKLHANDGVLWSFGTKFLAHTDGNGWVPISIPRI